MDLKKMAAGAVIAGAGWRDVGVRDRGDDASPKHTAMRCFINEADTLISLDTTGTVCRYTTTGWMPAANMTPQALAGPGWRPISASEAVRIQREITFGRRRPAG